MFPGTSELDQIHKMSELLGSPGNSWEDGVQLMNKLSMRLPANVENSSMNAIEEKIQAAIRREEDAASLITRLIQWNPAERPNTEEALVHEYFSAVGLYKPESANAEAEHKLPPNKAGAKNNVDINALRQGVESKRKLVLSKPRDDENAHLMSVKDKTLTKQANLPWKDSVLSRFKTKQLPSADEHNEFCEYLNAITSSTDGADIHRENFFQPCDQRGPLEPKFTPSERYRPRPMLSDSTPYKQSMYGVAQTIARSTKRRGGRQSLNKSSSRRRSSEKPRWLLSNQNMGRRAVEVTVGHSSFSMEACDNNHLDLGPKRIAQHTGASQKEEQRDSVWNPF